MDFALKRCAFASGALAYGPRWALRVEQALLAANVRALRAGRPTLTPRLGPRSPAAPSLRSGKLLPAARGQVRPAPWRGLPLEPACPTAVGAGAIRPRTASPRLGGALGWGLVTCRLPLQALSRVGAGQSLRLNAYAPFGALRAGALRSSFARFSGSVSFAGFARRHGRLQTGASPGPPSH